MKKKLAILMLCIPTFIFAQSTVISDGLKYCESTYPYGEGILVANFGTEQLNPLNSEGKGYIQYFHNGKSEVFIPADGNLSAPKGMYIKDKHLFVCDVNKIVIYDMEDIKSDPVIVNMPEGNLFVNDLAANEDNLYISVTNTDMVYVMNISNPSNPGKPTPWLKVKGPNGLLLHEGKMFIASYPADGNTSSENIIYEVNDLEKPVAEKFINVPGQYDGLAVSSDGNYIYVSGWDPAQVSRIKITDGTMETIEINLKQKLVGPADISVKEGKIYIPDLPNSRVVVVNEQ